MKPFLISQVPVFAPDSLGSEDMDYLKAAARDPGNQCVQEVSVRLHIQVSSNPDENLYLYGTPRTRKLFETVKDMGASAFIIDLDPTPASERRRQYELPHGVHLDCGPEWASISSALCDEFEDPDGEELSFDRSPGAAAADALDAFLRALAGKGFDLGTPAFREAFEMAVDAIGNNLQIDRI